MDSVSCFGKSFLPVPNGGSRCRNVTAWTVNLLNLFTESFPKYLK